MRTLVRASALSILAALAVLATACTPPPAPTISAEIESNVTAPGYYGLPVHFGATDSTSPDGPIVSYAWTFGDGAHSTDAAPTHVYDQPGPYTVTLTVTDSAGETATETTTLDQPAPAGDLVLLNNTPTIASNPGTTTTKVWWNNQLPGATIFLTVCAPPGVGGIDVSQACSLLGSISPNGTATGSGVADLELFRGPEPSGDLTWGCFVPGDEAPAGITAATTCRVRVSSLSISSNGTYTPFTISAT